VAVQQERPNGLVVTDNSGNYYYLRPEILAQAKMPDEDVSRFKAMSATGEDRELSADDLKTVSGGTSAGAPGILNIGHVPSVKSDEIPLSTVMCPW
jgi:hypothetical protein